MLNIFKKLFSKKDKKEKVVNNLVVDHPQESVYGLLVGMHCEACNYIQVDEDSSALPLEGFAYCPNCGALLKRKVFKKNSDGMFMIVDNGDVVRSSHKLIGGHYRCRKAGPSLCHNVKSNSKRKVILK